jgi:hypothetical protein
VDQLISWIGVAQFDGVFGVVVAVADSGCLDVLTI